jgi:mannose/fructose/N-acetylgalactosamine-specific phosphotransferase system component IID
MPEGFKVAAAPVVAVVGVLLCVWLLSTLNLRQAWLLAAILVIGIITWLVSGRRGTHSA